MITPCTKFCTIDPATRRCTGCGRTLMEIGQWMSYSEAERRRIMGELPTRLAIPVTTAPEPSQ